MGAGRRRGQGGRRSGTAGLRGSRAEAGQCRTGSSGNRCAGRQVGQPFPQHSAGKEPEVNLWSKSIKRIELGRIRLIRNEFNFILRMKCVY